MASDKQDLVPRYISHGPGAPAAKGGAAIMRRHRTRIVYSAVSIGRTAQSKIHIFEIRLETFVQTTDLLQSGASTQTRRKRRELDPRRNIPKRSVRAA